MVDMAAGTDWQKLVDDLKEVVVEVVSPEQEPGRRVPGVCLFD